LYRLLAFWGRLAAIGEQTVAFGCHFGPRGILGTTENHRTNRKSEKSKKQGKHAGNWPSLALAVARLGRSDKPKGPTDAWNMCFLKHTPKNMKKQKKPKNDDAKMESWKICGFWNVTRFLPKSGGLNRCTITVVLLKTIVKNVIKKGTTENKKNRKLTKHHPKNDVLKTSKSQRYSDYSGFVKSRVGEMMPTPVGGTAHFSPFWQKMRNSRAILAPLEIRKGTLNLTFSVRWSFKVVNF
jgi:hypothetical protein